MPFGTTYSRGLLFHPDPDVLVSLSHGIHKYDTVGTAKAAYVDGELSVLELESVLESLL